MANTQTPAPERLSAFVDELQASGIYTFTSAEARAALAKSEVALVHALRRLHKAGRITVPRRGFYVIVPTEYRNAGAPPPSWFIGQLMKDLGRPYYVGMLSAAAIHGASHQAVMVFQVVTDRPMRDALAGRGRIEFHVSGAVERTPAIDVQTETGAMRVSTPEATAFDLVRFSGACGGWSNVATVLGELAERIEPDALCELADAHKTPEIQRLGFLLDRAGHPRLADPLLRVLDARRYRPVALAPEEPLADGGAVAPWRVIPNIEVDVDQ